MVLVGNLLTLTGCASTAPLDWLRDDHADAIAQDLVIAVAERLPPSEDSVFVADMPLRDHFESAMRAHGYAVAAAPESAIEIRGLGERIPPNTWHVGLSIDEGIHVHRLYRIERAAVNALSAISVVEHDPEDAPETRNGSTSWHMRSLMPSKPVASVRDETHQTKLHDQPPATNERSRATEPSIPNIQLSPSEPDLPATSPVANATVKGSCLHMSSDALTFKVGSLKQGIVDTLARCGWRVVDWPTDARDENVIVDWIVTRETTVHVASVEDLLAGLRAAYGLDAVIDEGKMEVSFWIDES